MRKKSDENFKSFLKGHQSDILDILEKRMKHFSDNMEFERAINEREKINSLKRMLETQIIEYSKEINEDVFVFEEKREFVEIFDKVMIDIKG